MATNNTMKRDNASVLLADGIEIGVVQSGVKYRDLSGIIGDMMKTVVNNCLRLWLYSSRLHRHFVLLTRKLPSIGISSQRI